MFYKLSGLNLIMANLLAMFLWHMIVFVLSVKIHTSYFNPSKYMYLERKWEKSGRLYVKTFKIKKWKDLLPQHIGKNGFSKKHLKNLSNLSKDYIQQFIVETCRAEWNHRMCCMFSVISIFINSLFNGLIFSVLSLMINFPFIIIQRYNRIRLNNLLKRHDRRNTNLTYDIIKA